MSQITKCQLGDKIHPLLRTISLECLVEINTIVSIFFSPKTVSSYLRLCVMLQTQALVISIADKAFLRQFLPEIQ